MSNLNTNIGPERVQVFPVPLGTVQVPGTPTSVLGILISTSLNTAPVQTPVKITDLNTFVSTFGDAIHAGQGYYAVEAFYNNAGTGNIVWVVNVGSTPTANDYIGSASAGTGLRALDAIDTLGLVCAPGLSLSMAYLVQPAVIDYAKTVRTEFGATLSTTFSLIAMPKEITTSNVDKVLVSGSVSLIATNVVTLSGSPDLTSITPGMVLNKAGSYVGTITAVSNVNKTVTLTGVGTLATSDAVTLAIPSAVTYKESVINDPSKSNGWYYNWLLTNSEDSDALTNPIKTIDPIGAVAGIMCRIDSNVSIGGVSHAPAGMKFAGISGIIGLQLSISERLDAEPLRLNFINRITSFPGSGNVIFGGYTSDSGTSPTFTADDQLIQVIRAVQYIKGSLERGLRSFLWENFSPDTQQQVENAIASFLRSNSYLFPAGLPESQQFKVIHVEATQDDLNQGLLTVRLQVKPNKAIRFIEIDLEYPLPTA